MESKQATPAPTTSNVSAGFLKKVLKGSDFLTLEHVGHMAVTFMLCIFLTAGVFSAFSMWTGSIGIASVIGDLYQSYFGGELKTAEAMIAIMLAIVLLVAPMVNIALDRRTRATWRKRSGFAGSLRYKVPLYAALGLVALGVIICVAHILYAVVASLVLIGVQNTPISTIYLSIFLPSAVAALIFGYACWYLIKLAKGQDNGRRYSINIAVIAGVLAAALLVTSIAVLHNPSSEPYPSNDFLRRSSSCTQNDYSFPEWLDSLY